MEEDEKEITTVEDIVNALCGGIDKLIETLNKMNGKGGENANLCCVDNVNKL